MQLDSFTGGIFDTNCFYLRDCGILIDAPQGHRRRLAEGKAASPGCRPLLLTHGHIDHVWDAARIQQEHGCRVGYHPEQRPSQWSRNRGFSGNFGYAWDIEPITPGVHLAGSAFDRDRRAAIFRSCWFRGIVRGSLCFLDRKEGVLFGGDVLFAGGVGRWDLPGRGRARCSFKDPRRSSFRLGDDITVLPGPRTRPRRSDSKAPDQCLSSARMLEPGGTFLLEGSAG